MEDKEKIAVNAANVWCRCFKCDGRVNATGCACEKDKRLTCHKWYDVDSSKPEPSGEQPTNNTPSGDVPGEGD